MPFRLMSDPATGNVAIYEVPGLGAGDDLPLTDPWGNPQRLQWCASMPSLSTTDALTQQATITIPAQSAQTSYASDPPVNLFAHGKGEACMVEGGFFDPDSPSTFVPFNGTMPVKVTATGHATWLWLGATDTHVVCHYFGITAAAFSAFNVTIQASAYDFLASSGWVDPYDAGKPLVDNVPGSHISLGRDRFDSRRRYARRVTGGGDFALATGPTLSIIGRGNTNAQPSGQDGSWVQNEIGWRWRYSCAGYVKQTTQAWNGASTNGGTYDAPYVLVKR